MVAALTEFSWGVYLGQQEGPQISAEMMAIHAAWGRGETHVAPRDGESPDAVWARLQTGLFPLLQAHADATIAVVAHGRLNKILLSGLMHRGDLSRQQQFRQANTSVSLLSCDAHAVPAGPWTLHYENDRAHVANDPELGGDDSAESDRPPLV